MTIKELGQRFAYATPFGFVDQKNEQYDLNPRSDRVLQAHESIVLLQSAERDAATLVDVSKYQGAEGGETVPERIWTEDMIRQSVKKSREVRGPANGGRIDSTGWGVTMTSDSPSSSSSSDELIPSPGSPLAVIPAAALNSCDYNTGTDGGNVDILFCGWPGISYSMEVLRALDRKIGMERSIACGCSQGVDEMSSDKTRILILNQHDPDKIEDVLVSLRRELKYTRVEHARCDPRNRHELERVLPNQELAKFKGALTLVDIDVRDGLEALPCPDACELHRGLTHPPARSSICSGSGTRGRPMSPRPISLSHPRTFTLLS